ncbi:MAG: hypothetical protein LBE76_08210 [Nitrososphaerota archaeon]|nr:hypothetical protein [Nitrososphaerota archaeon]
MAFDLRVQAVEGYFVSGTPPSYSDTVYEGKGSAFTEFTIITPKPDNSGISKPNVPSPSNTHSASSTPTTSDPYNPLQQNPWSSYLIIILVTVCIITIPVVIVTYINKQRKNSLKSI